jgi:hypothetical protein
LFEVAAAGSWSICGEVHLEDLGKSACVCVAVSVPQLLHERAIYSPPNCGKCCGIASNLKRSFVIAIGDRVELYGEPSRGVRKRNASRDKVG